MVRRRDHYLSRAAEEFGAVVREYFQVIGRVGE